MNKPLKQNQPIQESNKNKDKHQIPIVQPTGFEGLEQPSGGEQNLDEFELLYSAIQNFENKTTSSFNEEVVRDAKFWEESKSPSPKQLHVKSLASIPIGRGSDLDSAIKSYRKQLKDRRKNIRHLEETKVRYGFDIPLHVKNGLEEENLESKELEIKIEALCKERSLQSRYEAELQIFTFLRQQFVIAQRGKSISNADILTIAEKMYPDHFNKESILLSSLPANLARQFENKNLIDEEISVLEPLTGVDIELNPELLKLRLAGLYDAKNRFERGDPPTNLPWPKTEESISLPRFPGNADSLHIFKLDGDRNMRIHILRKPSKMAGEPGGAISIYEDYLGFGDGPNIAQEVRMAITYYRTWDSDQFNLSGSHPNLKETLRQLSNNPNVRLCNLCGNGRKTGCYRLPDCTLFVRFYDEKDQNKDRLKAYNALHIPVCEVLKVLEVKSVVKATDLHNCSVPDWMFGELFNRAMLGSCWIKKEVVEDIYKVFVERCMPEKIGHLIHTQVYRPKDFGI